MGLFTTLKKTLFNLFFSISILITAAFTSLCYSQVICPPTMTVDQDPTKCSAVVNYTLPTVSGSCIGNSSVISANGYIYLGSYKGHYYYFTQKSLNWNDARIAAEAIGGHLATVGSAEENAFIDDKASPFRDVYWLGGFQDVNSPDYSEPAGGWKWVDGTPWSYTNWFSGEPNDFGGENFLEFYSKTNSEGKTAGSWNDLSDLALASIIEFDCIPIQIDLVSGLSSGSEFPVGTTTVTYKATDPDGNVTTCSFTVTVRDNTAPLVSGCPSDITVYTGAAGTTCNQIATWTEPTAIDDCSGALLTYYSRSNAPGSSFAMGQTTVKYTFRDASGNESSCSFTVTVIDDTKPKITSTPANITSTTDVGSCTKSIANIGLATAADNCSIKSIDGMRSDGLNLSAPYPFGVTTITWTATDGSGNTATSIQTININKIIATTTVSVTPSSQQYSDIVSFKAAVTPGVCGPIGGTVTFKVGTQTMGAAPIQPDGTAELNNIMLLGPTATGQMAPGVKTVTAIFSSYSSNYIVSNATTNLTITQENARVDYTGPSYVPTSSPTANTVTVKLRASVQDISAPIIPADPLFDAYPGNITTAKVRFIVKDYNSLTTIYTSPWLSPTLNSVSDFKTGTVTNDLSLTTGTQDYALFLVIVEAGTGGNGYYIAATASQTTITVAKPLDGFVTGGGFIIPAINQSAGVYASPAGEKANFGFNARNSKKGLDGNVNIIFRRTVNGQLRTYQIKASALSSTGSSLTVGNNIGDPSTTKRAVLLTKAILSDLTDPVAPATILSNLSFRMDITDRGEPGTADDISFSLMNGNTLLYSSYWTGIKSLQLVLQGGNIVIHSTSTTTSTMTTALSSVTSLMSHVFTVQSINPQAVKTLRVSPNPSRGYFEVQLNNFNVAKAEVQIASETGVVLEKQPADIIRGRTRIVGFNMRNYPAGVYVIRVVTQYGVLTEKVLLVK
jgi:hypothetical protein